MENKSLKMPLKFFFLEIYCQVSGLQLQVVSFPNEAPLKKTNFQLQVVINLHIYLHIYVDIPTVDSMISYANIIFII